MKKDLLLATALSAAWINIMFLVFGGGYAVVRDLVGSSRFYRFERALGQLDVLGIESVPWVGFLLFGAFMMLASLPVNYYWYRRLTSARNG